MAESNDKKTFNKLAALEALLFAYGEPVAKQKLFKTLAVSADEGDSLLQQLSVALATQERGLVLMEKGGTVMLATKPELIHLFDDIIKDELKEDLTPAATETLSMIAYFGPIARAHIDFIRGVNSSFILRNLLMRGLIDRTQGKGNAYVYTVSMEFLKNMGVARVNDLPEYEKYQEFKKHYFEEYGTAGADASVRETPSEPSVL